MKKLVLILAFLIPLASYAQDNVVSMTLRGMSERFIRDWNNDSRISFNVDLNGLEDGLKGFKRAVENPTALAAYVSNNGINLNGTNFGRSFKLGVMCGVTYTNVSGGWGGMIQPAESQWNNWLDNNNINIHNNSPVDTLYIKDYLETWFTDNVFNYATVTISLKAASSGLFNLNNGEAIIPSTLSPAQAAWIRQNVSMDVIDNVEYFSFDNLHWFELVEQ